MHVFSEDDASSDIFSDSENIKSDSEPPSWSGCLSFQTVQTGFEKKHIYSGIQRG